MTGFGGAAILARGKPKAEVEVAAAGQRHGYRSSDKFRRLGESLEQPPSTTTAGTAAIILRLLILTCARRGEIENLKWSEVDFNFGVLQKKTRTTGAKAIPLVRVAAEILEEQRRWVDRRALWVFPAARGDGRFEGLSKEWRRMRKLAGIEDVGIHRLRHTFVSVDAGDAAARRPGVEGSACPSHAGTDRRREGLV